MNMNLKQVLSYSNNFTRSREQIRLKMLDLFPDKIKERNILLDIYESGVLKNVSRSNKIDNLQYTMYIHKLVKEYGLQPVYVVKGLNTWLNACLGEEATNKLRVVSDELIGTMDKPITYPEYHTKVVTPKILEGSLEDYEVQTIGQVLVISKYKGANKEDIVIPNMINGMRVVGIGADVFSKNKTIKSLTVLEGIEWIGEYAFFMCSNLENVTFPTTLIRIGACAFCHINANTIELPDDIVEIGLLAFGYCEKLQSVSLPKKLSEIASYTFIDCDKLTSIELPLSIKQIEQNAFENCTSLSKVQLNEGLKIIDSNAFQNCTSLKNILIPSTVTEFGKDIFVDEQQKRLDITLHCYPRTKGYEYVALNGHRVLNVNIGLK